MLLLFDSVRNPWEDLGSLPGQYVFQGLYSLHSLPTVCTVPNPVLGGVTTFLFASVAVCSQLILGLITRLTSVRFLGRVYWDMQGTPDEIASYLLGHFHLAWVTSWFLKFSPIFSIE